MIDKQVIICNKLLSMQFWKEGFVILSTKVKTFFPKEAPLMRVILNMF